MLTRRSFTKGAALATAGVSVGGCEWVDPMDRYAEASSRTWRRVEPGSVEASGVLSELVRLATLAPSSHNAQCWRFTVGPKRISVLPDLARRLPVVDPDDHHLYVSLGCATENIVHASLAYGLRATSVYDPFRPSIDIALEPAPARTGTLFDAITQRQCTRTDYDGKPLTTNELAELQAAGSSAEVDIVLLTDRASMEQVLELVTRGNVTQLRNPAYVRELGRGFASARRSRSGPATG